MTRLIIVSNRTPGKAPAAGGLAVALSKTLAQHDGFWLGWSGRFAEKPSPDARFETIDGLTIAQIDLTREDHKAYYAGFPIHPLARLPFAARLRHPVALV